MPNTENIRKWVDALRSGDYPQGRSTLRNESGYCCLGVACDISGLGHWEPVNDLFRYVFSDDWLGYGDAFLPRPVREWLGIDSTDLHLSSYKTASGLNDNGATFDEIAEMIERKYL